MMTLPAGCGRLAIIRTLSLNASIHGDRGSEANRARVPCTHFPANCKSQAQACLLRPVGSGGRISLFGRGRRLGRQRDELRVFRLGQARQDLVLKRRDHRFGRGQYPAPRLGRSPRRWWRGPLRPPLPASPGRCRDARGGRRARRTGSGSGLSPPPSGAGRTRGSRPGATVVSGAPASAAQPPVCRPSPRASLHRFAAPRA